MLTNLELHQKILYPVVRIRTEKAGGSGTIIYSQPNPDNPEEYISLVLTCEHVIHDAITIKDDWDSVLKRKIKKEFTEQVEVEIFDYVNDSKVNSSNAYRGDIIAYDVNHDIAIVKLDSPKKCDYIAKLIPKEKIKDLRLFTKVFTSGCSLGHFPIFNMGDLTFIDERIDNKQYLMSNASSIFGNSGGALFLADTGEQIGITARISSIQLGFGLDIVTWMGFSVAPLRIYEFVDDQELKFLYDPSDTYKKALKRREKRREKALSNEDSEVKDAEK